MDDLKEIERLHLCAKALDPEALSAAVEKAREVSSNSDGRWHEIVVAAIATYLAKSGA